MEQERRHILWSVLYPTIFIIILWGVKLIEEYYQIRFSHWGIKPLTIEGLKGIIFSPFLHGDMDHLKANTIPAWFLMSGVFYYFKRLAPRIVILIWLISGSWLWLFARGESFHIGASSVIYGLAFFLVFSAIFKRHIRMLAFALIIVFSYGSLIWGFFPEFFPGRNISWEGHLMGALSGLLFAWFFRKDGPIKEVHEWPEEDEYDENDEDAAWKEFGEHDRYL